MRILLIGGRYFVGSAVADALRGHDVYTLDGGSGDDNHFQADLLDEQRLADCFSGMDAVVNLCEASPISGSADDCFLLHIKVAACIVQAAQQARVPYLVHMSALGAGSSENIFLQSKELSEHSIRTFDSDYLIMRPSLIFDEQSELLQSIAQRSWSRMFAETDVVLHPVYRLDLASWLADAITHRKTGTYEITGPDTLNLTDLAELVFALRGRRLIRLPSWTARLSAGLLAKLPSTQTTAVLARGPDFSSLMDVEQVVLDTSIFDWLSRR